MSAIAAAVDRNLEIIRELELLGSEFKANEALIVSAALHGEQIPLVDDDREGKQFIARGTKMTVPVIFTADLLIKSFAEDSSIHLKVKEAARGHLDVFFNRTVKFETIIDSGKKFRKKAHEILGVDGPAFVTACLQRGKGGIPKSQTRVDWDRASEAVESEVK